MGGIRRGSIQLPRKLELISRDEIRFYPFDIPDVLLILFSSSSLFVALALPQIRLH